MKLVFLTLILLATFSSALFAQLIQSIDLTAENLFSRNIEGPAVDKKGQLFVVNYLKDGTIGKVNKDGNCELYITLPDGSIANSIQFNSKGNMLLADFTMHNILQVDVKTKSVSVYCHSKEFNQPNDLCINSKDQLFASDPNWKEGTGKLWRIDANGKAILLAENMGTTNGIELSPDEKILYVNESVQRRVWAFSVDSAGGIFNKRMFYAFDDFGLDGMKCDKEGNLYITRYGGGTIAVISSQGMLIKEIQLKGKNCSNLVFGGEDGKTVFVTLQDRMAIETFRNDVAGKRY
jgi:sugar lactone lactonase YvrE